MSKHFVFVHGWGSDSSIWDGLKDHIQGDKKKYVDLGFVGDSLKTVVNLNDKAIFVTHSYGTVWALKHYANKMQGLIAINGFTNFSNFAQDRLIDAMHANLDRNPEIQMMEFWDACGLKKHCDGELHVERLHAGLNWMMEWDMRQALENTSIPVLSLAGGQDKILPLDKMKEEWRDFDLHITQAGDHVLPVSNTQWCATKIKDFIDEHWMEE